MATIAQANRAIAKSGTPLELVRGEGYHYFVYDDGKHYDSLSIYVPYTNTYSPSEWVEQAESAYETIAKDFRF